jgi:hypothetical protein
MQKTLTGAALLALLIVISLSSPVEAATPLPGAIFTTVADGTIVNANTQYVSKCDVYLNGGPGPKAPARAAGLPTGDYFFQVTDPSGETLLSTDVVNNRRFHVSSGVITAYTGTGGLAHPTRTDPLGATTISLANTSCPNDFLDTPNAGGVYKVWVTPVANFVGEPTLVDNPSGNGCSHGFASSTSKTDNFKVQPNIPTFCLYVKKEIVDSSGAVRSGIYWPITVTDPVGVTNPYVTNETDGTLSVCSLVAGSYTVSESLNGLEILGLTFNGISQSPQSSYSFSWKAGDPNPSLVFQNYSTIGPPQ